MEWVKVKYWRKRKVMIDDQESGVTNEVLAVSEGRHRFQLSPPPNYTPAQQTETIRNTTPQSPLEIEFLHGNQV